MKKLRGWWTVEQYGNETVKPEYQQNSLLLMLYTVNIITALQKYCVPVFVLDLGTKKHPWIQ